MKKMESLSKYKIENSNNGLCRIQGGKDKDVPTSTASQPASTMTASASCQDTQVNYDNDKNESTGSCTNYSCL